VSAVNWIAAHNAGEPARRQVGWWRTIWAYGVIPRDARDSVVG